MKQLYYLNDGLYLGDSRLTCGTVIEFIHLTGKRHICRIEHKDGFWYGIDSDGNKLYPCEGSRAVVI